jgi:hypothetical protein
MATNTTTTGNKGTSWLDKIKGFANQPIGAPTIDDNAAGGSQLQPASTTWGRVKQFGQNSPLEAAGITLLIIAASAFIIAQMMFFVIDGAALRIPKVVAIGYWYGVSTYLFLGGMGQGLFVISMAGIALYSIKFLRNLGKYTWQQALVCVAVLLLVVRCVIPSITEGNKAFSDSMTTSLSAILNNSSGAVDGVFNDDKIHQSAAAISAEKAANEAKQEMSVSSIRKDETIEQFAKRTGTTVAQIKMLNQLPDNHVFVKGELLRFK